MTDAGAGAGDVGAFLASAARSDAELRRALDDMSLWEHKGDEDGVRYGVVSRDHPSGLGPPLCRHPLHAAHLPGALVVGLGTTPCWELWKVQAVAVKALFLSLWRMLRWALPHWRSLVIIRSPSSRRPTPHQLALPCPLSSHRPVQSLVNVDRAREMNPNIQFARKVRLLG